MADKLMLTSFHEEHELFRQQCRRFVEKELAPHAREWEEKKDFPKEVFRSIGGGSSEVLKEIIGRMRGL